MPPLWRAEHVGAVAANGALQAVAEAFGRGALFEFKALSAFSGAWEAHCQ